jgi:hypothetical protein
MHNIKSSANVDRSTDFQVSLGVDQTLAESKNQTVLDSREVG